ncbi:MAG: DinB family protein [Fimbriimonas sp.]
MPTLHQLLIGRLDTARADLEEVIGRLKDEMLPWAPTEGMRTIKGQLEEIGATELQIMVSVREQRALSYKEASTFAGSASTVEELHRSLDEIRAETLAYLNSLSVADLEAPTSFPIDWFESLGLPETPLHEAFRSLAQHEWYHTGQLVSYLWARGDDPYKWGSHG